MTIPERPTVFCDAQRCQKILSELKESKASLLVLLGDIPIDNKVLISQNRGLPVISVHRSRAARAYHRISRNMLISKVHPIDLGAEDNRMVYGEEITI